jgi:hypothetical protein
MLSQARERKDVAMTSIADPSPLIVGAGEYRYEVIHDWAKLPQGWSFAEIGGIGVDREDNVYVFNRSEHPMMVFDRDGNFLRSWGEGLYLRPHNVLMDPDGETLWLTDDSGHSVRHCTLGGRVLLTLGTHGEPAPFMSGKPFNRPCQVALSPQGEIYVADGYGNARVHKFAPDGRLIASWGASGTAPGEFNITHAICCDADGWVYVADRENHRIQIFDGNGRYQAQWNNLHRPCGLYMPPGSAPIAIVGELGPAIRTNRHYPNLGPRVSILDNSGNLLARFGGEHPGMGPEEFLGPHGLALDSRGDLYIGEVSIAQWKPYFEGPVPKDVRCLRKFRKLA